MSSDICKQSGHLVDDVLLRIFDLLGDDDLQQCASVCQQWRVILFHWKNKYEEKVKSDEMWQKYSKALGFKPEGPCLSKYKKTYLGIEQLKSNWQTGKHEKKKLSIRDEHTYHLDGDILEMDNDFLLFCREGEKGKIQMIDLRTMEFKPNVPDLIQFTPGTVRMHDNVIMCNGADKCSIKVFDAITGQQINEIVRNGWILSDFDFGYRGLIAAFSHSIDGSGQPGVTFWRMNSPRDITFLHHCPLPDFNSSIVQFVDILMDDHYVAVIVTLKDHYWPLLYLVSTKTLSLENFLQFKENTEVTGSYQKGHLIFFTHTTMRLIDLSSGKSREVDCLPYLEYYLKYPCVASNSKYLAVKNYNWRMAIFDFEALMNGTRKYHIITIKIDSRISAVLMNEAQLICIDRFDVVLYDFRLKNRPKQKGLLNVTADAEHSEDSEEEHSECKRLKWDSP